MRYGNLKAIFLTLLIGYLLNPKLELVITVFLLYSAFSSSIRSQSDYYVEAYREIASMLDGGQPLSLKRAVFLAENAYMDCTLDYERDFCEPVSKIADFLFKLILVNKAWSHKTCKQIAICDFFFRPWSGNNYTPFTYYDDMVEDEYDYTKQFVHNTLRSHKGQCRSLPWTSRIIAEAMDAEVYIAYAPAHCYIIYPDYDDQYPEEFVNVELTTQQYLPTWAIKEEFLISDDAVRNGTYMRPLTLKELVARQLADLAMGYWYKNGNVYDKFMLDCVLKSLEYHPYNPNAIIIKGKSLNKLLDDYTAVSGNIYDEYAISLIKRIQECKEEFAALHWTDPAEYIASRRLKEKSAREQIIINHKE